MTSNAETKQLRYRFVIIDEIALMTQEQYRLLKQRLVCKEIEAEIERLKEELKGAPEK